MNISKREKTLIVIALIFAVICLYYFFFLQPYSDDMTELNQQISNKEFELSNNQQLESSSAAVFKHIEDSEQTLDELKTNIPQGYDQPKILVYLEDTITSHATKGTFLFNEVRQSGHLYISPVMVSMFSDYTGLKEILSELAQGQYFVKTTGLNISARSDLEMPADEQEETQNDNDDEDVTTPPHSAHFLEVTLHLEFYSLLEDIPPDTDYDFGDYQYGADIFRLLP